MGDVSNLRDCHRDIWKVICTSYTEALCCLLRSGDTVVLDVAVLEIRVESLKVYEVGDIRMSGWTVVALVEVVG